MPERKRFLSSGGVGQLVTMRDTNDALNLECDERLMGWRNPEQRDDLRDGVLTVAEGFDAVPDEPLTIEKFS